ncbi:MAG: carboxypeptidase regulatory-like domain-containing protein [Clostridium sp.]
MFKTNNKCKQVKVNLTIDPQKNKRTMLNGVVFNNNKPMRNVCISITTPSLDPITCCYTDIQGRYQINVPLPETINIIASLKGYNIHSETIELKNLILPHKINLEKQTNYQNLLLGKVVDEKDNPVAYANILIKELNITSVTGENGDFMVDNVPKGAFTLSITSQFYNTFVRKFRTQPNRNIYNFKSIILIGKLISGTVHGIIQSKDKGPIANALVVLFDADTNLPIEYTYTNQSGIYLFGNVPLGQYYIEANKADI